jgi:DNA-binding response OmpR family regulator
LCLTLESDGHRVLAAADGLEALHLLEAQPINLILSDVLMPRMNGYQLYDRVRGEDRWLTIPFIFLSACRLNSDIRYGKTLGVDDYLVKPIQPADLLATVRGNLRRAHQLAYHRTVNHPTYTASKLDTDPLTVGSLHSAVRQHRVWLDGWRINLSARKFKLLVHLAQRTE